MATPATMATSEQTTAKKVIESSDMKDNFRLAIGAAAAASAIFAPLSYGWKGVLAAVAAESILGGIYGSTPLRTLIRL